MTNLKNFIFSKRFLLHLVGIAALACLLVFGALAWLSSYTNHGEYVEVPDFVGKRLSELKGFIKDKDVNYKIIDSIYDPEERAGIVLRQDPDSKSKVKHNRTVYLYVTGQVPPQIIMPQLKDRSERQARLIISSYGLKVGRVKEIKADCEGCVLEQLLKGHVIAAGAAIPKGSAIDLMIGTKHAHYDLGTDSTSVEDVEDIP